MTFCNHDWCHLLLLAHAPNFSRARSAVMSPSVAADQVFCPGYTTPVPGPGLKPAESTVPQSWAAWRTKGTSFAKPLMLAAIDRIRSVALAPAPPQSSQALRYPGGRAGVSSSIATPTGPPPNASCG